MGAKATSWSTNSIMPNLLITTSNSVAKPWNAWMLRSAPFGRPPKLGSTGLLTVSSNSPSSIRHCIISCSMKPVSAKTTPSPVLDRYSNAFLPTGSRWECSTRMTRPSRPDFCSTGCMACSSMPCTTTQRSASATYQPSEYSPADPSRGAPKSQVVCQEI